MSIRPTALERAFTLARSGEYPGVSEIRAQLKTEGFAIQQLEGPSLMRQLRDLCIASRPPAKEGDDADEAKPAAKTAKES